jgi:hypothetical protein
MFLFHLVPKGFSPPLWPFQFNHIDLIEFSEHNSIISPCMVQVGSGGRDPLTQQLKEVRVGIPGRRKFPFNACMMHVTALSLWLNLAD